MTHLLVLREACCSVAIETGEDWRYLFNKTLLEGVGLKGEELKRQARSMAEKMGEEQHG